VFCHHCGNQLPDTARYCDRCGAAFVAAPHAGLPAASRTQPKRAGAGLWIAILAIGLSLLGAVAAAALYFAAPALRELGVEVPWAGAGVPGGSKDVLREGSSGMAAAIQAAKAGAEQEAALSAEQRLVRDVFGRPPAFRVIFGSDPVSRAPTRVETWLYPRQATNFVFRDGQYADSADMPRARALLRAETTRPEQFTEALSLAQVQKLHGRKPLFQIDLPGAGGGMTAVHFDTGLVTAFDRATGRLRFVEQLAERSKQ
jgi:hypothetical protein